VVQHILRHNRLLHCLHPCLLAEPLQWRTNHTLDLFKWGQQQSAGLREGLCDASLSDSLPCMYLLPSQGLTFRQDLGSCLCWCGVFFAVHIDLANSSMVTN
jgi:hypothetical protein